MVVLLILYLVTGLGLVGLAVPLLLGRVKPNPLYGFRLQATLENPAIWYAVNRHSAQRLIVAASCFVAAAVGLYLVPGIPFGAYAFGCLAVLGIGLGIGLWQSLRYMQALARKAG